MRRGLQDRVIACAIAAVFATVAVGAYAAIWPRRPAASGAYSCDGTELGCWDMEGSDTGATTGLCDGEVGNPTDTIDFADTSADIDCDATDGSQVADYTSGNDACLLNNTHGLAWIDAWPAESDNLTGVSFCYKHVAGTVSDMEVIALFDDGGAVWDGLGSVTAKFKGDSTNDRIGMRCPGNGTVGWSANNATVTGTWYGIGCDVDDSTGDVDCYINDTDTNTGGADFSCTGIAPSGNFNGIGITMCEDDDSAWRHKIDNLVIYTDLPTDTSTATLKCGDS